MRDARKGRILMISSVSGFVTPPTQGAYSASKHAIEALGNALRHELYPFGIHTILIQPGYIVTNIQPTPWNWRKPTRKNSRTGRTPESMRPIWEMHEHSREVQDHSRGLRAHHVEGHRSSRAKGALRS